MLKNKTNNNKTKNKTVTESYTQLRHTKMLHTLVGMGSTVLAATSCLIQAKRVEFPQARVRKEG